MNQNDKLLFLDISEDKDIEDNSNYNFEGTF